MRIEDFSGAFSTSQVNHSLRTQTYFRSSILSTRTFRLERSDGRKYVCIRKLGESWIAGKRLSVFALHAKSTFTKYLGNRTKLN